MPAKKESPNAKIHKWLSELESHAIYEAKAVAEDFTKATGLEPCWPVHTLRVTEEAIRSRGLGGHLDVKAVGSSAWGWEIAESLADKYGRNSSRWMYMGRGRRFNAALDSLKEA